MARRPFRRFARFSCRLLLVFLAITAAGVATHISASADPPRGDWSKLRFCESSGNYGVAAKHGPYYGAYQFDLPTWRSVGGAGYPNQASRSEQDYRALYLYRMRGWQPWECSGIVGLLEDGDANSRVAPSRADSGYISGESAGGTGGGSDAGAGSGGAGTTPAWPGYVYAYGDCSPSLRTFQLRMNDLGYDFDGTGCYLGKTRKAVLELQRANGIRDSGRLGPKTWKAAWQGRSPN
jgi:hypothetical protein